MLDIFLIAWCTAYEDVHAEVNSVVLLVLERRAHRQFTQYATSVTVLRKGFDCVHMERVAGRCSRLIVTLSR